MTSAVHQPPAPASSSSSASLPSSPVRSLPFIRRLFVQDTSSLPSSLHQSGFQPSRRHSFDVGTVVWTEQRSLASAQQHAAASSSSSSLPGSAASSPASSPSALPISGSMSGVNAMDLSSSFSLSQSTPRHKQSSSKMLETFCKCQSASAQQHSLTQSQRAAPLTPPLPPLLSLLVCLLQTSGTSPDLRCRPARRRCLPSAVYISLLCVLSCRSSLTLAAVNEEV
jgi:hypothetical protein